MKITVDRIEGDFAVCELENMSFVNIPLNELPEGIREGNVLLVENNTYAIDIETEKERKKKLFALQNSIFDE